MQARSLVAGGRDRRSLRGRSGHAKTSARVATEVVLGSLVAEAGNQRFLRLVEQRIPRLAA